MTAVRPLVIVISIAFAASCGGDDGGASVDAGDGDEPRQTIFGGDRPVEIIVGRDYDHETPTPMLFVLHGLGATGPVQAAYTKERRQIHCRIGLRINHRFINSRCE